MIRHRNVPSSESLELRINPSSPIGPSNAVRGLFAEDSAGPRAVKNVTFSFFTSVFTQVFTLWTHTPRKVNLMPEAKPKKQRPENYQNGRERPHFFGFQPPKKFVGSLPPSSTRHDSCTVASTRESAEQQ
jgi:hypothetical protein